MAKFRITTVFSRMQRVEGSDPKQPTYHRVQYPAGSVIEPTNAEYQAFKDVLTRVEEATPLTERGAQAPQADPNAPYNPEAAAAAAGTAPPSKAASTPEEGAGLPEGGTTDPAPTVPRRR